MPRWLLLIILLGSLQTTAASEGIEVHEVTAFASPDSNYDALKDFILSAERSLYINVYTFESPGIAELLTDASSRGVEVVLMVESSPAGGVSNEEKALLGRLQSSGVQVYLNDDPMVRFNHAKYAIADYEAVLVTSENFSPRSFPMSKSYGNRGWGVVIRSTDVASYFSKLFYEDLGKAQIADYQGGREGSLREMKGTYKPRFEAKEYKRGITVIPLYAPVDALDKILQLIRAANESLYVEEFYAYKYWGPKKSGSTRESPNMFLEAAINAARKGVEVKILLDSTWYNIETDDPVSNYYTVKYLDEVAKSENLNLEARLADLKNTNLAKVHNKGLIVDNKLVLISSVNWNEHSPTKNREVGVIIQGAPAEYYTEVFMYDWNAGSDRRNYYIVAVVLTASLLLIFHWRKKILNY